MKRFHSVFCWGLLIAGSVSPLYAQQEFPLKDKRIKNADDPLVYALGRWFPAESEVPTELKDRPSKIDHRTAYFLLPIGGRKIVALHELNEKSQLHVDTDGDGDLAKEKPLSSTSNRQKDLFFMSREDIFGPVSVHGSADGSAIEVFIRIYQGRYAMVFPSSYKTGTIKLAGKSYNIALLDRNLDGRYDGVLNLPLKRDEADKLSDLVAVDLDQDGAFNPDYTQSQEIQPVTKIVLLNGTYYTLNIEPSGKFIRLTRANPRMGTLDTGSSDAELMLASENGLHRLERGKSQWTLPVGRYSIYQVTLRKKDAKQTEWTLQCSGDTGKLNDIQITDEQVTTLKIGAPMQMSASVTKQKSWFRNYLEIAPIITGQAGETYGAYAQQANRRSPAPKFKILDEQNKVLASGQFEYG